MSRGCVHACMHECLHSFTLPQHLFCGRDCGQLQKGVRKTNVDTVHERRKTFLDHEFREPFATSIQRQRAMENTTRKPVAASVPDAHPKLSFFHLLWSLPAGPRGSAGVQAVHIFLSDALNWPKPHMPLNRHSSITAKRERQGNPLLKNL